MAQRRTFRSLATTTRLRRLAIHLAHAEKARSVPLSAGDGTGDAGEAAIGAAIPQKAIFLDGDVVGGALPFPHQNAPAARKRTRQSRWHLGALASEHLVQQPSQFLGDRFAEATQTALLLGVGNAERKHVTTQRSRRLLAKLLSPERAQRAAGQAIKVRDTDLPITAAIAHASLAA